MMVVTVPGRRHHVVVFVLAFMPIITMVMLVLVGMAIVAVVMFVLVGVSIIAVMVLVFVRMAVLTVVMVVLINVQVWGRRRAPGNADSHRSDRTSQQYFHLHSGLPRPVDLCGQ
ncbi:MAG: hypothetical protein AAF290_03280 [Pseudomonadota bacterium]